MRTSTKVSAAIGLSVVVAPSLAGGLANAAPAEAQNKSGKIVREVKDAHAVDFENVQDLIKDWTPGVNVYVKNRGAIGLDNEALDQIATWVKANHPHWTVILAGDASGENFTATRGNADGGSAKVPVSGYDALDAGVGQGLMNKAAFSSQMHDGVQCGSILMFCFNPRKYEWYSSKEQENNGFSHDNDWLGGFGNIARESLRANHVFEAVTQTITAIETAVGKKKVDRVEAQKRQAEEQKRQVEEQKKNAAASVARGERELAEFQKQVTAFQADHQKFTDHSFPDMDAISAAVRESRMRLDAGKFGESQQTISGVLNTMHECRQRLNEYPEDGNKISDLGKKLGALRTQKFCAAGKKPLDEADAAFTQAKNKWEKGDFSYRKDYKDAEKAYNNAFKDVSHAAAAAKAKSTAGKILGLLAFLVLGGTLGAMVRRRSEIKAMAVEEYRTWKTAFDEKAGLLLDLDQSTQTTVGNKEFTERTKRTATNVLKQMPDLFCMYTGAQQVMEQARALIYPRNICRMIQNLFSGRRYEEAMALLKDTPITFAPDSNVQEAVSGKPLQSRELWADIKEYEPFQMSFDKLVDTFNNRAKVASDGLNTISTAIDHSLELLTSIESSLGQIAGIAAESEGSLVPLRALAASPVQSLKARCEEQKGLWGADPIGACDELEELNNEAAGYVQAAQDIQKKCGDSKNEIDAGKAALTAAGHTTAWIDDTLREVNGRVASCLSSDNPRNLTELGIDAQIQGLADSVEDAAFIAGELSKRVPDSITEAKTLVAAAREKIGTAVGATPSQVLHEEDANPEFKDEKSDPDSLIAKAEALMAETSELLNAGKVEEAEKKVEEIDARIKSVQRICADSEKAADAYKQISRELTGKLEDAAGLVPSRTETLRRLRETYAESALVLGAGDPTHPRNNNTLDDNLTEAEESLAKVRECLVSATQARNEGKVLQSVMILKQVSGLLDFAGHRFAEIMEKKERLESQVQANTALSGKLEEEKRALETQVNDPRVSSETAELQRSATTALDAANEFLGATPRDPYAAAEKLAEAQSVLGSVGVRIEKDIQNHGAAVAAIERAVSVGRRIEQDLQGVKAEGAGQSGELEKSSEETRKYLARVQQFEVEFKQRQHADWVESADQANKLIRDGNRILQVVEGEIQELEEAHSKMEQAERRIADARRWSGSYGVTIYGSPGATSLHDAQDMLAAGNYADALVYAERALSSASRAIEDADAEVERKEREEQERIKAQERAEEAARLEKEEKERERNNSSTYDPWRSNDNNDNSNTGGGFDFGSTDTGGTSGDSGSVDTGGTSGDW